MACINTVASGAYCISWVSWLARWLAGWLRPAVAKLHPATQPASHPATQPASRSESEWPARRGAEVCWTKAFSQTAMVGGGAKLVLLLDINYASAQSNEAAAQESVPSQRLLFTAFLERVTAAFSECCTAWAGPADERARKSQDS